ncbi:Transposase [Candidatus Electrothrix aarhusensis]
MRTLTDKYINLFTDFGFKKLFGTEFNKPLLIDFLNQLIGPETGLIKDLTFLSTEQLGRSRTDRQAIFDIYCENEIGEKFIVELQKAKQNYFKDRSIYYSTFPIQQQAKKGEWNFKLKAVYTIGILDFVFEEDKKDDRIVYRKIQLMDVDSSRVFYDKLTYIYLEMPKFRKTEEELETHFDKWLYVLKNLHLLTDRPKKIQERIFGQLFEQAEIAQFSEQEYQEYENSLKYYRDLKNSIDTAFDEGKIEGRLEGEQLGIEKGIEQGKIETARAMKSKGLDLSIIAEVTGLAVTEIEKL